jgi:hypothetical protein
MKKHRVSKYPLILIENEFVKQRMKFTEIMDKYGISKGLLSYHSKRRNWLEKRKNYYEQIGTVVLGNGVEQGAKEQKSLIERLQYLLDLKLAAETKVFKGKTESDKNTDKEIMHLINKSKDPVGELTKIIELLKGNATGRVEVTEKEKATRYNRLKEFMTTG